MDEKPKITGEDGIHALKTVLAAMKSAKEKIQFLLKLIGYSVVKLYLDKN